MKASKAKAKRKNDDSVASRPDPDQGIIPCADLRMSPSCSSTQTDDLASPRTILAFPDNESSKRGGCWLFLHTESSNPDAARKGKQPARHAGVIIPSSSSTTRTKPISAALANKQNNTPSQHTTYLDAARKGKQALAPLKQPKEITSARDNVEHHSRPPTDPNLSYDGILTADKQPSPPPASHRAANVAGASDTGIRDLLGHHQVFSPSAASLEILDHSFEDQGSFSLIKLNAPQLIPDGADFEKEEVPKIRAICEPHVGGLKSIQNLGGFKKKHRLVRRLRIIGGKMTILVATAQGRLLAQAMVAAIWECHSQKRSWNGTFDSQHIRIIKPCNSDEFMMILKDPVRLEGEVLLQAIANDLDKTSVILESLYMVGDDYAVYFKEFIENLKESIGELAVNERAFMEYLRYHPAVMPSSARSNFVSRLSNIGKGPLMHQKPPGYPDDWAKVAKSEIGKLKDKDIKRDKKKKATDIISVLYTVYTKTDNYNDRVGGLIRFMRNVFEHGKQHDNRVIHGYELELYVANMFNTFLPSILLPMLMKGEMEHYYGEDWSSYKMSKRDKWEPTWSDSSLQRQMRLCGFQFSTPSKCHH